MSLDPSGLVFVAFNFFSIIFWLLLLFQREWKTNGLSLQPARLALNGSQILLRYTAFRGATRKKWATPIVTVSTTTNTVAMTAGTAASPRSRTVMGWCCRILRIATWKLTVIVKTHEPLRTEMIGLGPTTKMKTLAAGEITWRLKKSKRRRFDLYLC